MREGLTEFTSASAGRGAAADASLSHRSRLVVKDQLMKQVAAIRQSLVTIVPVCLFLNSKWQMYTSLNSK